MKFTPDFWDKFFLSVNSEKQFHVLDLEMILLLNQWELGLGLLIAIVDGI